MRVRRLKLLETEIVEREAGGYEAIVKLRFLDRNFIGIEFLDTDESDEQNKLDAIAKATLDAIKQALSLPINIYLRKAVRLRPEFLSDLLLVVMVDIYIECKRLELTGCCVCLEKDISFGIARATLDSTNRIVDYLLTKQRLKT